LQWRSQWSYLTAVGASIAETNGRQPRVEDDLYPRGNCVIIAGYFTKPIYSFLMKFLFDFLPALLFFSVYTLYDTYVAAAVAMVATAVQVSRTWIRHRRVETGRILSCSACRD
jgi:hypothetical protein